MTLTRTVLLAAVLLAIASRAAAGTAAIDLDLEEERLFNDINGTEPELGGTNCGGNCPGGNCNTCPCGTTRSVVTPSTWCSKFTGWSQACCTCIMTNESGGNSNAVNQNKDTRGSLDVGLWQINDMNWASCSSGVAPCDPTANLGCAKKIFAYGPNNWRLWSTCGKCGCCGKP